MSVEARGFVLRRNWLPIAACALLVVAGALATRTAAPSGLFGYLLAWFGLIFGPVLFFRNAFPRAIPTTIRASATRMTVDDHREVQSEDIVEAKVIPRWSEAVVELALRDRRTLSLRMAARDAKALVGLLGARRTRFRLVVPFAKRYAASFALLAIAEAPNTEEDRGAESAPCSRT